MKLPSLSKIQDDAGTALITLMVVIVCAPGVGDAWGFLALLWAATAVYVGIGAWQLYLHVTERDMTPLAKEVLGADPEILGGKYVLPGTRFPIYKIMAGIAEDASVTEIAEDYNLDQEQVKRLFQYAAAALEKPKVFSKARVVK